MKKALCLTLALLLTLTACAGTRPPEGSVLTFESGESGELYFYGVVKSGGTYYAKVLKAYQDTPAEADFLYAPLADPLHASFQEEGWVGAWNPTDYDSARALARAAKSGKITQGAHFTYSVTDGRMDVLQEHNYYADNPVTGQ